MDAKRIPLGMVPPANDGPVMPRHRLLLLTERLLKAPSLRAAQGVADEEAKALPADSDWRKVLSRIANGQWSRIFGKGNGKLPFYTFSTLPLFTCPGKGECATWCYSLKSWQYPPAWGRQLSNTLLVRFLPELLRSAWLALPGASRVRLYVDGDFDSEPTVALWMGLQREYPHRVYGYSKSWDLLYEYHLQYGVPSGYVLNLSGGGANQRVSKETMLALPFVRGEFVGVPVSYNKRVKAEVKYADRQYHKQVREAAIASGVGKTFSCPGRCGVCRAKEHACGDLNFRVPISIGIH